MKNAPFSLKFLLGGFIAVMITFLVLIGIIYWGDFVPLRPEHGFRMPLWYGLLTVSMFAAGLTWASAFKPGEGVILLLFSALAATVVTMHYFGHFVPKEHVEHVTGCLLIACLLAELIGYVAVTCTELLDEYRIELIPQKKLSPN